MGEGAFDKYLTRVEYFQARMDKLEKSIETSINNIFIKLKTGSPTTFGDKIDRLEEVKPKLKSAENFDETIKALRVFSDYWNIAKHGIPVCGDVKDVTLYKDGVFYTFDQQKRRLINEEFTQTKKSLVKIYESVGNC